MYFRIILVSLIILWLFNNNNIIEGYESYTSCIEQGYPKNFCLHVPVQSMIYSNNFKKWKPKYK